MKKYRPSEATKKVWGGSSGHFMSRVACDGVNGDIDTDDKIHTQADVKKFILKLVADLSLCRADFMISTNLASRSSWPSPFLTVITLMSSSIVP